MRKALVALVILVCVLFSAAARGSGDEEEMASGESGVPEGMFEVDTFTLGGKTLDIYAVGHGSIMLVYGELVIQVDPVSRYADYAALPAADLVLITHEHGDHLDAGAIEAVEKENTVILINESSYNKLGRGTVMKNGEVREEFGIRIEAVPAYNTTEGRDRFHPRGRDNGYILTLGGKRVYFAGDTEDVPEMYDLKNIYIAFLPMNQPYTMVPAQVASVAKGFKPEILFPYYYGETPVAELEALLSDAPGIELRIRQLQ